MVKLMLPEQGPLPLTARLVTTPAEIVEVSIVEDCSLLTVQVVPNADSLNLHSAPVIVSSMPVMFGSVPKKDLYLRCHGSDSLLTVMPFLVHLVTLASVM